VDRVIDTIKIEVLAKNSWLLNWVSTAHKNVRPKIANAIQKALIDLPPNTPVIQHSAPDDIGMNGVNRWPHKNL